jgi:IstB-like ATP binding protein
MIARNKRPLCIESGLNPSSTAQVCRNFVRVHVSYRAVLRVRAFRPSLVDRLVHNAEIVAIKGESYRLKEARERADAWARKRRGAKA